MKAPQVEEASAGPQRQGNAPGETPNRANTRAAGFGQGDTVALPTSTDDARATKIGRDFMAGYRRTFAGLVK